MPTLLQNNLKLLQLLENSLLQWLLGKRKVKDKRVSLHTNLRVHTHKNQASPSGKHWSHQMLTLRWTASPCRYLKPQALELTLQAHMAEWRPVSTTWQGSQDTWEAPQHGHISLLVLDASPRAVRSVPSSLGPHLTQCPPPLVVNSSAAETGVEGYGKRTTREGTSAFSLILCFETKRWYSGWGQTQPWKKSSVSSWGWGRGLGLLLWTKGNYTSTASRSAKSILVTIAGKEEAQLTSRQNLHNLFIPAREKRHIIFFTHRI